MRVGVPAYLVHGGEGYRAAGVSVYTRSLLEALPTACAQHTYVAFQGPSGPHLTGVETVRTHIATDRPLMRIAWEQTGLVLQLRHCRLDLVHAPVNVVPLLSPNPTVVTVHDLSFLRHPERFHAATVRYLRAAVALSVRKARAVIAVSRNTHDDLMELCGVPDDRIQVIYPGVDPSFRRLPEPEVRSFRMRTFDAHPYILFVGTLEPRKNIDVLIRAFAAARRSGALSHHLALVGGRGWMYQGLFDLVRDLGLQDTVHFVGFVPQTQLPLWYNGADIFVYPSAYEGFGFPVLEAMACGVPTVTSSSSALAEVAGEACVTVPPNSEEALQMALTSLLADDDARGRLRAAGLQRASAFSWQQTAKMTVGVYERVMGE